MDENQEKLQNQELEENTVETNTTDTENGIEISTDVIAVIAGVAVSEVQGVSGMSGGFAGGISEVLSGKKNLAKGIKGEKENGKAKIDVVNVHVQGVNTDIAKKENNVDEETKENKEE